jgi:hypothetical protein
MLQGPPVGKKIGPEDVATLMTTLDDTLTRARGRLGAFAPPRSSAYADGYADACHNILELLRMYTRDVAPADYADYVPARCSGPANEKSRTEPVYFTSFARNAVPHILSALDSGDLNVVGAALRDLEERAKGVIGA